MSKNEIFLCLSYIIACCYLCYVGYCLGHFDAKKDSRIQTFNSSEDKLHIPAECGGYYRGEAPGGGYYVTGGLVY